MLFAPADQIPRGRRVSIGPGSLDRHAPRQRIAGLGDAAAADSGAGRMFGGHQAEIGHRLRGMLVVSVARRLGSEGPLPTYCAARSNRAGPEKGALSPLS